MTAPDTTTRKDMAIEEHAMRKAGILGRGKNTNQVYAIDYDSLPPEARTTIGLIVAGGPFPHPGKDGSSFGNKFGDLPEGQYLEYTVPTPGLTYRGARRIVARKRSGQLFFTACHYERVGAVGGTAAERKAARAVETAGLDADWRNGFYIITGMALDLRNAITEAIRGTA